MPFAMNARLSSFFAALAVQLTAVAAVVELSTGAASCRVDLDGARILSYRANGVEVLWNDDPPQTNAIDWAHGGIPICWPRFGVDATGKIHGTAWRRTFAVNRRLVEPSRSELVLGLSEGPARLEYFIVLTDCLSLEMVTTNTGTNEFMCSYGFHPYLRVAERDRTTVDGVDALAFEDDPSRDSPERGVWRGMLALTSSIDRIFRMPDAGSHGVFAIHDRAGGRIAYIECLGANHVNVWNPGSEKNCPGVVPGDEWRRFACVEPILVGGVDGSPLPIPPGKRQSLKMTIRSVKCEQDAAR